MSHQIVTREDWIAARKVLLDEEKALTRARDALSAKRRELPWVELAEDYAFDGPDGRVKLSELFGKKSQLIIKHFMFGPGWEEGCIGCSFECDHINAALPHLQRKDVAFAAVSRAPVEKLEAFRRRMGWDFVWVSSGGARFNYDFHVTATEEELERGAQYYNYEVQDWAAEELSGISVFAKGDGGKLFHTYSTYGRGFEEVLSTYAALDLLPKGREEAPGENLATWVTHRDKYATGGAKGSCCSD